MSYFKRLTALFRVMHTISAVYCPGSKILLWSKMVLTVLQPRLPRSLRTQQKLELSFEGKSFGLWMEDRTGLAAFEEVFIRGEYSVDASRVPFSTLVPISGSQACIFACGIRMRGFMP